MKYKRGNRLLIFIVISINITAIYCMMYHGITDRFASTFNEVLGFVLLIGILSLNTLMLIKKANHEVGSKDRVKELSFEC